MSNLTKELGLNKKKTITQAFYNATGGAEALAQSLTKASNELSLLNDQLSEKRLQVANAQTGYDNALKSDSISRGAQQMATKALLEKVQKEGDAIVASIATKTAEIEGIKKSMGDAIKTDPILIKANQEAESAIAKSKSRSSNVKLFAITGAIVLGLAGIGFAIHLMRSK